MKLSDPVYVMRAHNSHIGHAYFLAAFIPSLNHTEYFQTVIVSRVAALNLFQEDMVDVKYQVDMSR